MFHLLPCRISDFQRRPDCKGIRRIKLFLEQMAEKSLRLRRAEKFLLFRLRRA